MMVMFICTANVLDTIPGPLRDRMEEADRAFFERVAKGFETIAAAEPKRVRLINGIKPVDIVCAEIWEAVRPILPRVGRW